MTKTVPRIITISGTTGSGKTTIARKLMQLKTDAQMVISYTTRGPRESDLPGEYQYNVPLDYFEQHKDEFLWVVTAHGNIYGTTKASIKEALASSKSWLMILIPPAVELLRNSVKEFVGSDQPVLSFYILSPGEKELQRRLINRKDSVKTIQKRLEEVKRAESYDKLAWESDIPYTFLTNNDPNTGSQKAAQKILKQIL